LGITLINGVPLNAGAYLKDQDIVINKNQPQLVLNRNDSTTENIIAFNTAAVQKWQIATSTLNEQYLIIYGLNNNGLYLWRFDQTNGLLQYYDGITYHTFWHDGNFQPSNYVTLTTFNNTITGLSSIFLGINATAQNSLNSTNWNSKGFPTNANGYLLNDGSGNISWANTLTAPNTSKWNNQSAPANPASTAFLKMATNGAFSTDTNTYLVASAQAADSLKWNTKSMPANAYGALKNDGNGNLSFGMTFQTITTIGSCAANSTSSVYQAASDGFVILVGFGGGTFYTDTANPPTTGYGCGGNMGYIMTFPVKKGNYYKMSQGNIGQGITIYFVGLV